MELRHLRYFVAVAEEENITRAAVRLRIAAPPLSRQLKDLECELGVPLFERGAHSIRLTRAGTEFLEDARGLLQQLDKSIQRLVSRHVGTQRHLDIGYAPSLTARILPLALRKFETVRPDVSLRIHDMTTREMLEGIEAGKLDVALMILNHVKPQKGIILEELARFGVCVAMGTGHPLAVSSRVSIRQLAGEQLVAYHREGYPEHHEWLDGLFHGMKRRPAVSDEYDSASSLIAAVEAGRGIAMVQEGFETTAGTRVAVLPLDPQPSPLILGLAHRQGHSSEDVACFIESAREAKPG